MYVGLFLGHSVLKNGNITSASSKYGNEYKINKILIEKVAYWLKKAGVNVDVIMIPEKTLSKASEEANYKLPKANSGKYSMIVELHLNSYNGTAKGAEVLYSSSSGKVLANRIQKKLVAAGFANRNIKERTNLYMLSKTIPTAVIIESFFVDNKEDIDLYNKIGADELGRLLAEGISGKSIPKTTATTTQTTTQAIITKGKYRVVCGAFSDRNNAIALQDRLKQSGYDSYLIFEKDI